LRVHPNLLLLGLVPLLLAFPFGLSAQENDCLKGPPLLSPSEPIYSDAMELKQTLESHGFVVRCVFPTKLGGIFEVWEGRVMHSTVAGEANFRTNYGEVDAVFMPHPQTFADFKITEHRKDSGFLYTFGGTPRVRDTNRLELLAGCISSTTAISCYLSMMSRYCIGSNKHYSPGTEGCRIAAYQGSIDVTSPYHSLTLRGH